MRNYELSTPSAAERYFSHSIFGQIYMLLAETLSTRRRMGAAASGEGPQPPAERSLSGSTLLDRLDAWCWRQAQHDREAYLAASRDRFELERRIDALARGTRTRRY